MHLPIISLYALAGYRLMPAIQQIYNSFTQLTFIGPSIAKLYDDILRNKLNGNMLIDYFGEGDDQDDDKYETKWEDFQIDVYGKLNLPEPEKILLHPIPKLNNLTTLDLQIASVGKNNMESPIIGKLNVTHLTQL